MSNGVQKRNRVLLIVGGVLLACAVLSLGAAAVGGAVFALASGADQRGPVSADISLALPTRATSDDDERGIVIAGVVEDGPAARAGVERGDILLELDGEAVNSHRDLLDALDGLDPGDEVEILVLHGDEERLLTALLDEQGDRAFLGVIPCCPMQEGVSLDRVLELGATGAGGALITEVVEGSPADEAGLAEGDVIVAVDGQALENELTLADAIGAHEPGDRVTLEVKSPSEDESRELTVELGEHPGKEGVAYLGVTYAPSLRGHRFSLPEMPRWIPDGDELGINPEALQRVTVVAVDSDSPAEDAGIQKGDVILSVDGTAVQTPQDVVDVVSAADPGDALKMTISRPNEDNQDEELELSVTLGEHPEDEERAYLGVRLGYQAIHLRRFGGEWNPEQWRKEYKLPENRGLPFDLDKLPGLELPFNLDELPDHFHFEWPPGEDVGDPEFIPGGDSA